MTHLKHSNTDLQAAPSGTAFSLLGILLVDHSPYRSPMAGCTGLCGARCEGAGAGSQVAVHLGHEKGVHCVRCPAVQLSSPQSIWPPLTYLLALVALILIEDLGCVVCAPPQAVQWYIQFGSTVGSVAGVLCSPPQMLEEVWHLGR